MTPSWASASRTGPSSRTTTESSAHVCAPEPTGRVELRLQEKVAALLRTSLARHASWAGGSEGNPDAPAPLEQDSTLTCEESV